MSYRAYTRLLYSLIGTVCLISLTLLLISVLASEPLREVKKFLAGLSCAIFSTFFLTNAVCGMKHKRMLARGSPATAQDDGRWFYWFHIPMNIVLGASLFYFAIQIWRGVIHVDF
jgi:hypothetical protein